MPPRRNLKILNSKPKPPPTLQIKNDEGEESIDAELRFDQEVLWCITQFEKLIESNKINDSKSNSFNSHKIID